ncbi:beta-Ig-H3/fasciclin [Runella slithyformis DSM 19594]|uniref:Beta-Ig-H3/fasciclin n=2 Tax=Runella TaxID=105 RepID=A0A7U3ZIN3_RUNSL|nr:beta-Ig-H3/fasciclin [Runella slithyformis DSM 19594]
MGCRQDEPQPKSISDILLGENNLTILRAAITHAGLQDAFKTSTVTLFAPTDEGFKAAGYADASAITALPPEQVRALITNHVITSNYPSSVMKLGALNPVSMLSRARLYLSFIDGIAYLNQARANKLDLAATNGVVHVINGVVPIPLHSLGQLLKTTPEFSLFRAALMKAVGSDARLKVFTDSTGANPLDPSYTIFLPTNSAMEAAGLTLARINSSAVSSASLANLVSYHIVLSRFFSPNLPSGNLPMFDASFTTFVAKSSTGIKITGRGAPATPANVTKADVTATNGVIYVIDRVLSP